MGLDHRQPLSKIIKDPTPLGLFLTHNAWFVLSMYYSICILPQEFFDLLQTTFLTKVYLSLSAAFS